MKNPTPRAPLATITAAGLLALLAGCSDGSTGRQSGSSGLDTSIQHEPESTRTDEDEIARRMKLMSEALASESPNLDRGTSDETSPGLTKASDAESNLFQSIDVSEGDPMEIRPSNRPKATTSTDPPRTPIEHSRSREEQRHQLSHELAALIRAQAREDISPMPALMQLAALEMVQPGVFNSHYLGLGAPGMQVELSDDDLELIKAWRDMFNEINAGMDTSGEFAQLPDAVDAFSDHLREWRPLEIATAALCTRVDGFGLFAELKRFDDQYKLIAGRRHRIIVYAEVDHFAYRPTAREGQSGFIVEMTQDLRLHLLGHAHPSDGSQEYTLNAWSLTDQAFDDFSRNKRRDFFVVQIIELPETLSVGSYNLKITTKDQNSGETAEAILPLDLVADRSALVER